MVKNEKGFTLLEMSVCILLLLILLKGVWGFFSTIYIDYLQFNQQMTLDSEASTVEYYIKEFIRLSDQLEYVVEEENDLKELKRTNSSGKSDCIKLEKIKTPIEKQGQYALNYYGNSSGTPNLISDQIERIKITRDKTLELLKFECQIYKANETSPRLKVTRTFTEYYKYKRLV